MAYVICFGMRVLAMLQCVCVSYTQLTDNVSLATAGAQQRFLASCGRAILQANHRSEEEAIESIIMRNESVFDLRDTPEIDTLARINCPQCLPTLPARECCGHGQCVNDTCQCDEGRSNIAVYCRLQKNPSFKTQPGGF